MSEFKKTEFSIQQILESESYKHQKEVVNRAINKNVVPGKIDGTLYAPARIADLRRTMSVDYTVFKKPPHERAELAKLKKEFMKELKKQFPDVKRKETGKSKYIKLHTKLW